MPRQSFSSYASSVSSTRRTRAGVDSCDRNLRAWSRSTRCSSEKSKFMAESLYSTAMHTLAFLDPGHFHAALTLRERNPRVSDTIIVYAPEGPELREFLALVDAFNRRAERPTAWQPDVRIGDRPLE